MLSLLYFNRHARENRCSRICREAGDCNTSSTPACRSCRRQHAISTNLLHSSTEEEHQHLSPAYCRCWRKPNVSNRLLQLLWPSRDLITRTRGSCSSTRDYVTVAPLLRKHRSMELSALLLAAIRSPLFVRLPACRWSPSRSAELTSSCLPKIGLHSGVRSFLNLMMGGDLQRTSMQGDADIPLFYLPLKTTKI